MQSPSAQPQEHPAQLASKPALLMLCIAILCAQLDMSMTNIAVKPVGESFNASLASQQWFLDAYNLSYASLLLTGGVLADLFGRRRVFVAGNALFGIGSILCATAPTISMLLFGRLISGVGAALLLPASLALIRVIWKQESDRGRVLGIWAGCHGLALVIGPVLGGALMHYLSWRSIFILTIPLAFIVVAGSQVSIPESADREGRSFDLAGQILGFTALASLTIAAIQIHQHVGIAILSGIIFILSLASFITVEHRRHELALMPTRFFKIPQFLGSVLATISMTFGMYSTMFLLPLTWLETGQMSIITAGIALLPCAIIFMIISPLSGAIQARIGLRAIVALGLGSIMLGIVLIATTASQFYWTVGIGLALTGLGMGLAIGPLMGGAVNAVDDERAGSAGALINVARMVGATLGIAIIGSLYGLFDDFYAGLQGALLIAVCVQIIGVSFALRSFGKTP